jgi:perosamine synthetase
MKKIPLFYPSVSQQMRQAAYKALGNKIIGQGPEVDEFEKLWQIKISNPHRALAVGSGTDALHLSYILAGVKEGDEVITPIFTFPATNIALLYQKAKIIFADVKKDSLNISPEDIARKITPRTKAIVAVHYGGLPCDMDEIQQIARHYKIPVIGDAAYAHGTTYKGRHVGSLGDFNCFSFQAVKMITTISGGILTIKDPKLLERAKKLRWLGIDRTSKLEDRRNDINTLGFRYQMSDVQAALGLEALKKFDTTLKHYQGLADTYREELSNIPGISYMGGNSLCIVLAKKREELRQKLARNGIESSQVDYRNDRYTIFGGRVKDCPNMDKLESKYLVLPTHFHLQKKDIRHICRVIKNGQ